MLEASERQCVEHAIGTPSHHICCAILLPSAIFESSQRQRAPPFPSAALIEESINNWRTVQYDKYQTIVNDIL
jgi:hypothetical protein